MKFCIPARSSEGRSQVSLSKEQATAVISELSCLSPSSLADSSAHIVTDHWAARPTSPPQPVVAVIRGACKGLSWEPGNSSRWNLPQNARNSSILGASICHEQMFLKENIRVLNHERLPCASDQAEICHTPEIKTLLCGPIKGVCEIYNWTYWM